MEFSQQLLTQVLIIVFAINYIGYVGLVSGWFGILPSVSDSFREWKKRGINKFGNPFTYFCWIITFTILPAIPNPFFWGAAAGIGIVGTAFNLDDKNVERVHGKAAVVGILSAVGGIMYSYQDWWIAGVGLGIAGLLALFNVKNKIFWVENVAFLTVITSLFKNNFDWSWISQIEKKH